MWCDTQSSPRENVASTGAAVHAMRSYAATLTNIHRSKVAAPTRITRAAVSYATHVYVGTYIFVLSQLFLRHEFSNFDEWLFWTKRGGPVFSVYFEFIPDPTTWLPTPASTMVTLTENTSTLSPLSFRVQPPFT